MGWESNNTFQQVIIVGPAGNILVYNPTTALGNLVSSMAGVAFTDTPGNAVLQGTTDYFNTGAGYVAVNLNNGAVGFFSAATEAGPWTLQSQIRGFSGAVVLGTQVLTLTTSGLNLALGPLTISDATGKSVTYSDDASGYPTVADNAGLTLNLSGCQPASGNKLTVTTATFGSLGFGTIPAGDAEAGAVYEFECGGYGTNAAVALAALTLQARFGTSPGAATDVVGTGFTGNPGNAVGDAFQWSAKVRAQCLTSGGAATWRIWLTGSVTDTVTNFSVPFAVGTGPTDVTLSSTAAINIGLSAEWASVTNAPTITKSGHQFGRRA